MLTLYLFSLLARFFFVPLVAGGLWGLYAWPRSRTHVAGAVGASALVGLGLLGGFYGVPGYYAMYKLYRASLDHFNSLCEARAVVQFPATREPALGVVWEDPGAARATYLSNRDSYRDFIGPGSGRYMVMQQTSGGQATGPAEGWDEDRALTLVGSTKTLSASPEELPFSVRTQKATGPDDERYGVEGVETTVTRRSTGEIIAKRVVFARHSVFEHVRSYPPLAVCPSDALQGGGCEDRNGCSVLPFIVAAVPPKLPADLSKAFHLSIGSGPREFHCSFRILIGPGIAEKDVIWWADPNDRNVAGFRIIGTRDALICPNFFMAGGLGDSRTIRFADSGIAYETGPFDATKERGTEASPHSFLATVKGSLGRTR